MSGKRWRPETPKIHHLTPVCTQERSPHDAPTLTATLTLAALFALPAAAQHAGHAMPAAAASSPSTAAYQAANDKMHQGMTMTYTGNPDRDFLAGMIPHHQGAIDMAEVELKHGKDPKVRKLAQDIIKAQKREIAQMQAWLKQMDAKR